MTEFHRVFEGLAPWIHEYGAAAVFVIVTFESFGVPLPGESLLIAAAILSRRGDLSFSALLVSAWSGAVIGDNIGYLIGRVLGRRLLLRFGAKIGLTASRLRRVEATFARYGPLTVGFARFVNVLRQLNGVVAGSLKMDWRYFLVFNALGGAIWVIIWTAVGAYIGERGAYVTLLIRKFGFIGTITVTATLTIALILFYFHNTRSSAQREDTIHKPNKLWE